jgi:RNA polymerase sigma-70 factor, ECF subfamily
MSSITADRPGALCSQEMCVRKADEMMLAARLQHGDSHVIYELIEAYQIRLRRLLIRMTGDRELAEDFSQETWLRVLLHGAQYKGDAKLSTWIFAIARNLVFDQTRRLAAKAVMVQQENGKPHPIDVLPSHLLDPFEMTLEGETARRLRRVLATLTPKQRRLVELRYTHELPLDVIARATGLSLGTVKSTIHRSLLRLRKAAQSGATSTVSPRRSPRAKFATKHDRSDRDAGLVRTSYQLT